MNTTRLAAKNNALVMASFWESRLAGANSEDALRYLGRYVKVLRWIENHELRAVQKRAA